jgi:hypothetical protein
VVTYPYSKDVVMSPAGAFLAVAVCVAARNVLVWLPSITSPRLETVALAFFTFTGAMWAVRLTETNLSLRAGAVVERNEWAYKEEDTSFQDTERRLFRVLREDALFRHPAPGPLASPFRSLLSTE